VATGFAHAIKLAQIAYTYLRVARKRYEVADDLAGEPFPLRRIVR
jgi:hypothetical protein